VTGVWSSKVGSGSESSTTSNSELEELDSLELSDEDELLELDEEDESSDDEDDSSSLDELSGLLEDVPPQAVTIPSVASKISRLLLFIFSTSYD